MTDTWQNSPATSYPPSPAPQQPAGPGYLDKYAKQMEGVGEADKAAFEQQQSALAPHYSALSKMGPAPAPPQQEKIPPAPGAEDFQKNSMAFASAMAVLGAVASRFTRMSGQQALSAFAGAVNGWKQGNMQAYESAAKQWEENTKKTIENNRQVMDQYKLALENRKMNIDEQMSQIQLIATQYHDKIMFDAAAAKNYTLVASIYEKNEQFTQKTQESFDKLQEKREEQRTKNEQSANYWLSPGGQVQFAQLPPEQQAAIKQMISLYAAKGGGTQRSAEDPTNQKIAESIINGKQPPVLTGLYGRSGPVRAILAEQGFDDTAAVMDWQRAQKQIQSLNGPQMTRFVGLATSVKNTIDEARDLGQQMKMSGVPALNALELQNYIQAQGNSPNGKLATRYVTAINTLKEEFANLAQGGYAPTEAVWALANKQINENYGVGQLDASLTEVQRLINYRLNAIPGLKELGAGAPNRYIPGATPAQGEQPAGAGEVIRYDAQGNRVQ